MQPPSRAERLDSAALEDQGLLKAWRDLAVARENPFLTPDWFKVGLQHTPGARPFAIAWRSGEELRGVLPLLATDSGPLTVLSFAGSRRGDWFGPLCRPEDEVEMAAACAELLEAEGGAWNLIRLNRVDLDSAWPDALARAGAKLSVAPRRRLDVLPYIEFGPEGYEEWLASRSRNFRSQLGRRRRRLERDHGLSYRMTASPAELEADLEIFFRLHDERWEGRGGSTFSTAASRELLTAFAAATQELGWLRLWIAEAEGEPAGAWYGWRIGARYCYSLAGFAARWDHDGIGNVILAHTIEQAAAEGARTYDMMWGDEGYKARFETGRRYAGTWLLGGGVPTRLGLAAAVGGVRALESLPPSVSEPLRRAKRSLRRS